MADMGRRRERGTSKISKRLNSEVMSTCVRQACMYGTYTLAHSELPQQRLQVCEYNCVRKNKSNEGRQEKNGGVKGRDGSAEGLDRETGEEQITVDRLPKRAT